MTKNIIVDGALYQIYTEKEEGYYFGCWKRMNTDDSGQSSKHCFSEAEAIEAGEHNARMGHKAKFGTRKT